jgi:hypothetical protein
MAIKLLIHNGPVIGSVYSFAKTAIEVKNCSTPTGELQP